MLTSGKPQQTTLIDPDGPQSLGDDLPDSFLAIFEAAPTAMVMVDETGGVLASNRQAQRTFGYDADVLATLSVEQLLPERARERHRTERAGFVRAPTVRAMGEGRDLTALHRDGREFPVEIGLSPIAKSGKTVILVTIVDLTARKRLELELVETNQCLEEFCRVTSHDLKSPLRGVASLVEWLENDLQQGNMGDAYHNLERIKVRVLRLEHLIEELLSYAHAGELRHAVKRFEPRDLVDDVVRLHPPPPHIELHLDVPPGPIDAAWVPLHTVLRNLLANAYKHHDLTTGGTVEVEVRQASSVCEFAVRDNGPGIPEAARERVFGLFQTLSPAQAGRSEGIGLALAKHLVVSHGGRIALESNEPERGVTARVWWPRVRRADLDRTGD